MINKPYPPRRTHRKRVSALHLSSDTTATLPEYYQPSTGVNSWQRHTQETSLEDDIPSDKPPDYPDSAEEADEDTDSEDHRNIFFTQQQQQQQPPTGVPTTFLRTPHSTATTTVLARRKQRLQHKRKHSAPPQLTHSVSEASPVDPYLDALLERSVHALEMSNTLLQSSITAQTSLSSVFACDSPADHNLEARAINLSAKIGSGSDRRAAWMDDLEEITRGVDSLFGDGQGGHAREHGGEVGSGVGEIRTQEDWSRHLRSTSAAHHHLVEAGVSCSLPTSASLLQQDPRRRPSLDLREAAAAGAGAESSRAAARLRLSHRSREDLIAPPPRALTQYIESDADPAIIALPSTLGLRSNGSMHLNAEWNGSTASLHSSPALPIVTETLLPSSSTPAYTKLASFVINRQSNSANATPASSFTSSFTVQRRNSSAGTPERGRGRKASSPKPSPRRSVEFSRQQPSPGTTLLSHQLRPMTPTAEESSSSSDGPVAKQTISNLRKILDEQRAHEDARSVASSSTSATMKARPPAPIPLTPPPAAVSGTSTATASISRMLTKKVHHSSTRPPSPPRQSAMKGSRPATPSSTTAFPTTPTSPTLTGMVLGVPERISVGVKGLQLGLGSRSASSSGMSTPRRISFAELPEAHVSSRPEKFRDKKKKRKDKSSGNKGKGGGKDDDEDSPGKGWLALLFGAPSAGTGAYGARQEERMEDRVSRNWGGRGGGSGYGYPDEWAV